MFYDTSQKSRLMIDQMIVVIKTPPDGVQALPRLKLMELTGDDLETSQC